MVLVLGDAHAADPDRRRALRSAYEAAGANAAGADDAGADEAGAEDVSADENGADDAGVEAALQTGDLQHYDLPVPTWFVAGNNEDLDVVDALRRGEEPAGVRNARLLASEAADVAGLRVAGLSGNYAPTRYEKERSDLEGDRRRHFVRAEVERAAALTDVDVFLAHEAPHGLLSRGYDVGCKPMDEVLGAVEPDLCLVGHHHEHAESTFGPTRVVSLAPAWEAYYLLDPATLSLSRRKNPAPNSGEGEE